ncbi:MAG: HAMP domain-containing histidine kinase [Clostridiales bacterium]|nr:HAMP domain-containing histidine kinase [Clostridiales bacterium]
MIKKAQIKFVCLTMSILFGVFGVLFLTTTLISNAARQQNIENSLDTTVQNYLYLNDSNVYKSILVKITFDTETNKYERIIIGLDHKFFTQDQAERLVNNAIDSNYNKGKIGKICYKKYDLNHNSLLVLVDANDIYSVYSSSVLRTFLALSISFIVLFCIVYGMSYKIFKPIQDSFLSQKRFISNASHELKTPVAIISANADVLKQDSNPQWIDNIKSQTSRMSGLINDMLSLTKMDEGITKTNNENFCLSDEIVTATLPFDALAFERKKRLLINVEPDIFYHGDKACVNQIVNILLDNAIKHSDEQGEIFLELKKEKNKNVLTVFNTGSDVPTEQSHKVFERFYRSDSSRSRETGGSGLGLSIAKGIADLNKWKIRAESIQGESMTIIVTF